MKRTIYLLLLLGLAVHQIKTNNYVSSVFWYCPATDLPNQLFFGAQSPSAMEGTYGQELLMAIPLVTYDGVAAEKVVDYLSGGSTSTIGTSEHPGSFFRKGSWFNQALIGPYFSTWGGSDLYITQPHSPKNGANAAQLRLLGLGIQDCSGSIVPSYYGHSYGMLKEQVNNTLLYAWANPGSNFWLTCFSDHLNAGFMLSWLNGHSDQAPGAEQYYINQNYSIWDWKDVTATNIMMDALMVFFQSFQSSLFKEQIHISNSDFNPPLSNISGLDATTYFKNNKNYTVYLRLNLITPGIEMTINSHTNLYYVMGCQNTYTHMYSQDGSSACGDDYGF